MGRKPKLDERQLAEIGRRIAMGESLGPLAKAYKVSKTTLSRIFSGRTETVRTLANTLATTEQAIERLPKSEQTSVRTLADHLKGISRGLAQAADHQAKSSARLAELAHRRLEALSDDEVILGTDAAEEGLKQVMRLSTVSNEASKLGLALMAANKEASKALDEAPAEIQVLLHKAGA